LDGNDELIRNADAVESFLNAKGVIYAISDPTVPPTPLGTAIPVNDLHTSTTAGNNMAQKGIQQVPLSKEPGWDNEFTTPKR
jgi:hypothetical protein